MISKSFSALERIESITKGLRTFSRMDSSEAKTFSPHKAVNDSIDLIKGIYKADLNLRLLIIDVESGIRDVLKMSLETIGLSVTTCDNGQEGLNYYLDHQDEIDVIISDIKMPALDGISLLKKIRDMKNSIKQPFCVLLTGGTNVDFESKELKHLADGFLMKPLDFKKAYEMFKDFKDK